MLAQVEERQHLAKQLSKLSEESKLRERSWRHLVRSYPDNKQRWHDAASDPYGLHHYNSARYEHEGLSEIHARSYAANVLLEVRDVRVPASSHHPSFTRLARHRTHLICYTHADLIDAAARDRVERWTAAVWPDSRTIFVDTRSDGSRRRDELHYFDALYDGLLRTIDERGNNVALTVGVANVGKSSVLAALLSLAKQRGSIPKNATKVNVGSFNKKKKQRGKARIRKGRAPDTEDVPGKTRAVTEYLLREKPKAYFMDVPGITPPAFFFRERPAAWFGYGATNLLPLLKDGNEDAALHSSFCEYVLHCANRDGVFQYVEKLGLDGPTDDIDDCLGRLANKWKDRVSQRELRLRRCRNFLKLFNTGNFGPLVLDDMSDVSWEAFEFRDEHFSKRSLSHGDAGGGRGGGGGRRSSSRDRAPRFDRETMEENGGPGRYGGRGAGARDRRGSPREARRGRQEDREGAPRYDADARRGDGERRNSRGSGGPRSEIMDDVFEDEEDDWFHDRNLISDGRTSRFEMDEHRGGGGTRKLSREPTTRRNGSRDGHMNSTVDDDDDDWFHKI